MKVGFMGTPEFAARCLEAVLEAGHEVRLVLTQPDKPKGRKGTPEPPPVKKLALARGIEVYQPERLKKKAAVAGLREILAEEELEFFLVAAYGHILPKSVLEMPRGGCINVHASLLPKYRGAAPINWAVANGEKTTGVTIMQMDPGMDTGPMLLKREIPIEPEDDAVSLTAKLADLGAGALVEFLELHGRGGVPPTPQNDEEATLAPMLKKEDGLVDWSRPADEIRNLVRGMVPWPVAHTPFRDTILKIYKAEALPEADGGDAPPGRILAVEKRGLSVATGAGTLLLTEVQQESRKRMGAWPFAQGSRVEVGETLG